MSLWWGTGSAYAVVLAAAIALRWVARRPTRVVWTASSAGVFARIRGWGERLVLSRHREEAMAALLDEIASATRAGTSLAAPG